LKIGQFRDIIDIIKVITGGTTAPVFKGDAKNMGNLLVFKHPLIEHKLTIMRDKETGSKDFRQLLSEISMLMGYELTRDLPTEEVEIETPVAMMTAKKIAGKKLAIVPILRAGLGMVDGLLTLIPVAKVGHIGLFRDPETHLPVEYYCKLPPDIDERIVIIVDPMLATGGSASDAIMSIKNRGCQNIKLMCLVAAPEGVKKVQEEHPDVDIFVAALDERLNEHAYIVPGLGDAGDRLYGTK
jgi:uracil phosphoribosyltransferase